MYKKSRRKIILSIMGSLVFLFIISLSVILITSILEIRRSNFDKLKHYSDLFFFERSDPDFVPKEPVPDRGPDFELSTFYAVAFSKNNEVLLADNAGKTVYTQDELVQSAEKILQSGKKQGNVGKLLFLVADKRGYTLVSFLDNTVTQNSLGTLYKVFLIVGILAIVFQFFVSLFLSKRIIKPLAENDRKQKQFISDASHELKTPVAVINANAELLSGEIKNNEWLSNIIYENERMEVLLKELLSLSRAENTEMSLSKINLSHLVTGEVLAFEGLAYENGKTINSEIEEDIFIMGNNTAVEQISSVLLDNAIKHSSDKEITVNLKKAGHNAVLYVENKSKELDPQTADRLFDRFFRIDQARSSDGHYGLGLSIAKALTEKHKGKISVSFCDGKIRFTVTLPL